MLSEQACAELTSPLPASFPFQQRFQDTSQYVCAELQALEQEQGQIDGRAAEVERQLRRLMESGGRAFWGLLLDSLPRCAGFCHSSRPWEELGGGTARVPLVARRSLLVAQTSEIPQENKPASPIPSCSALPGGISGDCPGLIQVPTGCRRRR